MGKVNGEYFDGSGDCCPWRREKQQPARAKTVTKQFPQGPRVPRSATSICATSLER